MAAETQRTEASRTDVPRTEVPRTEVTRTEVTRTEVPQMATPGGTAAAAAMVAPVGERQRETVRQLERFLAAVLDDRARRATGR